MFVYNYRLLDNLDPDSTATTSFDSIQAAYKQACTTKGWYEVPAWKLAKILLKLFPSVKESSKRSRDGKKLIRMYKNIQILKEQAVQFSKVQCLLNEIPPGCTVLSEEINSIKSAVWSFIVANGNRVCVELHINVTENKYVYIIQRKEVNHKLLGISNEFVPNKKNLSKILYLAKQVRVCCGEHHKKSDIPNRCVKEHIAFGNENNTKEYIRCVTCCKQVVPWTSTSFSCGRCQKAACDTSPPVKEDVDLPKNHIKFQRMKTEKKFSSDSMSVLSVQAILADSTKGKIVTH